MSDIEDIRRELDGRPAYDPGSRPSRKKPRPPRGSSRVQQHKAKQPTASPRASDLGQTWYDLGSQAGFDFPYDANYFALALQRKIETEREFDAYFEAGKHEQVQRWVRKMIEIWWNPGNDSGGGYLTNEISARNAKEYFLSTDWDDLREYAKSTLIALYLRENGRRVAQPEYPNQREYQARLEEVRKRATIESHLGRVADAEEREPVRVDEGARARLRSWRDQRRKK